MMLAFGCGSLTRLRRVQTPPQLLAVIDENGDTALHAAAKRGHAAVVSRIAATLAKLGQDCNSRNLVRASDADRVAMTRK
jgi:ankyrin repeat protein